MIAEQYKKSILHAAIQGKLTQQLPTDGNAQDLIQEVQKVKTRIIKECKIGKDKPLPVITEDEIPFEIPKSWQWTRLGEICIGITSGATPSQECFSKVGGIPYLKVYNIVNNKIDFHSKPQFINENIHRASNKRSILYPGDVIMNIVGPPLGKIAIVTDEYPEWNCNQAIVFFRPLIEELSEWIYTFLCEGSYLNSIELIGTAGQDNISVTKSKNILIPIPPLEEQKRIIKIINSIFPKIEMLKIVESKIDILQKAFPKKMKDSVLQYAIEGKLTEQLESDGDAHDLVKEIQKEKTRLIKEGKIKKEKPLPEIAEDAVPFDIPENWCWERLGNVITVSSGQGLTKNDMDKKGKYPVYGGNGINGYHNEGFVAKDTLVIGRVGFYCGCVHKTIGNCWVTDNALIVNTKQNIYDLDFLRFVLTFLDLKNTSVATAQPVISGMRIYPCIIPLPPLAEQKRIVKKLEQLLPEIAKLEIQNNAL